MNSKPEIDNKLKNLQVVLTKGNKPDSAMPSRLGAAAKRRLASNQQDPSKKF